MGLKFSTRDPSNDLINATFYNYIQLYVNIVM